MPPHRSTTTPRVMPAMSALAEVITAAVPRNGSPVVLEVGLGTASLTESINRRLAGCGRHIAAPDPWFDLANVLAGHGIEQVDVVICARPWSLSVNERRVRVVSQAIAALAPGGVFTTIAYAHARWTPSAVRLRGCLRAQFEEVVVSRTVWANVPPALVYFCRRPKERLVPSEQKTNDRVGARSIR